MAFLGGMGNIGTLLIVGGLAVVGFYTLKKFEIELDTKFEYGGMEADLDFEFELEKSKQRKKHKHKKMKEKFNAEIEHGPESETEDMTVRPLFQEPFFEDDLIMPML